MLWVCSLRETIADVSTTHGNFVFQMTLAGLVAEFKAPCDAGLLFSSTEA